VDVDPKTVAHEGPVYERPYARPAWQDALQADDANQLARPANGAELREQVLALVGSPNQASKAWITSQYDHFVQGNTVLAQPEDAGMIRIDADSGLGVAIATDGNGRYAKLDPYAGAQLALAEAYRNVAATGAKPLAVSDCLNFGSPEDPAVMWQFAEAVRGLADGCLELGTPVTGGNVSLYNQTGEAAIHPTDILISASRDGMIDAAHDLSDGGLVQALVESCLKGGRGARIVVPDDQDPFVLLFSESAGRAIVAVPRSEELRFTDMCGARGLPATRIGVIDGDTLDVQDQFTISLSDLREAHEAAIPALFG
ncbi:AIR synthase related protein, partial [Streptomyces rimosus]|uniref:AIR synthase related protein n=1 Tax=Streptomyces rimosus TaxID=1927 RepID=UPI0004C5B1CC